MVVLRRRRIRQWFLLVPVGVVTAVAALFYGTVRFRAPAEVALVVLAAPSLVLAARWVGRLVTRGGAAGAHSPSSTAAVG